MHAAAPEVLAVARGLQLAIDRHRTGEAEIQPFERGIVGVEPPVGPDGATLQVPDVHSQHSRLKYLGQRLGSRLAAVSTLRQGSVILSGAKDRVSDICESRASLACVGRSFAPLRMTR